MIRAALLLAAVVAAAAPLAACESSQDKSARIQRTSQRALDQKGLRVGKANGDVRVVDTKVIQDQSGAAAVVVMRSGAPRPLAGLPVAIDVRGKGGKALFRNDDPGIEPSLTGPSVLPPGRDFAWVHDQVVADGRATSVEATVGRPRRTPDGALPRIEASRPALGGDPTSGIEARGTVRNLSKVDQRDLVLYCVARKGGRIVAAGRGGVPRLPAGKSRSYQIFFIGDPRGARLVVEAPPTVLE